MMVEKDAFETEREKLQLLKSMFEKSVENNSIEDMRAHVHPEFSFVSFTDRSFDSFDAFKKQWEVTRDQMVGSGRFTTHLMPDPTLFTDEIAISYGRAENTIKEPFPI